MVVVLLAGAGLLIRSYINVESVDTGFTRSAVTFHLSLDQRHMQARETVSLLQGADGEARGVAWRAGGGISELLPLTNSESLGIHLGRRISTTRIISRRKAALSRRITFEAMHIPLIAGRYFTEADAHHANQPVIINQKFAKTFFPNRNPIGGRISTDEKHAHWSTVVGVVADVRHVSLEEEPQPQMYGTSYDFGDASLSPCDRRFLPARSRTRSAPR